MATKFSDVFDDEILESRKPAGCIGGIFQLFDCQQLLGGRQLSEQGHKRDPSAHAPVSLSNQDFRVSCNLEKNQSRRSQDNPRSSMESSRTSFSSSFISFSSLEHKSPQEEPICTHHSFFSGRSPRNSPKARSSDINKSPAFKDIVKESIYRDFRSASIKEDDDKRNEVMKPIHSPRPMDLSKVNDLDESLRIMYKLKDSAWSFYEGHSPRFSYDGTENTRAFIDVKQYSKHREPSRLSLDSKEGSLRCNLSPKFNSVMKEFDKNANKRVPATSNQLQDPESNEKNSSIIAKLMGLEPLNSATKNTIRCNDPFNKQKNQIVAHERKQEKPLLSPRNTAKSPRTNNPHLGSPSNFSIEETPQTVLRYVEENMKQKIESVFNAAEKRLQKVQCHHSSKELQDLKRVILETKKNCNRKLSSVNSFSTRLTPPNYKSNEVSISERGFKSPIVIMEPARKLDVSVSKVTKLEGLRGLGKIRTAQTNAEQSFTEKKVKCLRPYPLSKESSVRAVNNTVNPRSQQMKPDLEKKTFDAIPTYDSNKSPRRAVNNQLSDSVSPRCKLRKKPNKVQDIELQNSSDQVNVEAIRANRSIEGKSHLFQQSIRSSSITVGVGVASVAKKHPVILKDLSAKEPDPVSPQRSSPNSVPDASLNQDGLPHSPVSVSKVFKAEYQNLPLDRSFTMECLPLTLPSTVSSRTDSEKPESKNTTIQGSRVLGTTISEARETNTTMFTLENQDQDNTIVAEIFLASGLLQKDSDLISMLDQINPDKPSEFVQKNNPQKLHQTLIFDVVNEILAKKMKVSSSGGQPDHMFHSGSFSVKHLYKELCSEIKCLQSCNERHLDDNSMIHKDLLRHSPAWDSFESEIPVVVLEIERLIFKDLINEVVHGVTAVVL